MNVNTGELRMLSNAQIKEQYEALEKCFTAVPDELQEEAITALNGKEATIVDLEANTPLANWAKQERKRRAKSNRAKMKKKSQRRNRR